MTQQYLDNKGKFENNRIGAKTHKKYFRIEVFFSDGFINAFFSALIRKTKVGN